MKLTKFKLRNYRSFLDEQEIDFAKTNVLIGPNNVGKSNFLRAIELFFSTIHYDQNYPTYQYDRDFPRDLKSGRTSLTALFLLNADEDSEFIERYDRLRRQMKLPVGKKSEIQ